MQVRARRPYAPDPAKLAALDQSARREYLAALAVMAMDEAANAREARERIAANNAGAKRMEDLRREDEHVGADGLRRAQTLLEEIKREGAKLGGTRPEKIEVPEPLGGARPVH